MKIPEKDRYACDLGTIDCHHAHRDGCCHQTSRRRRRILIDQRGRARSRARVENATPAHAQRTRLAQSGHRSGPVRRSSREGQEVRPGKHHQARKTTPRHTLQLTESAERDLANIWAYLAVEASESIATRFLSKLHATCERLLPFPLAHPKRPQLAPGLRVVFHGAYAIYYCPDDEVVTIVRVLHGARDLAAIADQGGFEGM